VHYAPPQAQLSVVAHHDKHVGHIFKSNSAPADEPWFWSIGWFDRRASGPHQAKRADAGGYHGGISGGMEFRASDLKAGPSLHK
jgi:hypothetical protein